MSIQSLQKSFFVSALIATLFAAACSKAPEPASTAAPDAKAVLLGVSTVDLVGKAETAGADGNGDASATFSLGAGGRITAIQISNTNGQPAIWDTVPADFYWVVGVAPKESPQTLLNAADGSISLKMDTPRDFVLYFTDNGSVLEGKTDYAITVTYDDGSKKEIPLAHK